MIIDAEFQKKVREILAADNRYAVDAYAFVNEVVAHTVKKQAEHNPAGCRHVSGGELLEGFRDLTNMRFGPLAYEVLTLWGINNGLDVGNIVFNMINYKLLRKSAEDSIDDFNVSYDFKEAFLVPYQLTTPASPTVHHIIA